MNKKTVAVFLVLISVISIFAGAAAASLITEIKAQERKDFKVVIDGKTEVFKTAKGDIVYPILYDGTTYLPIRAIGEIMDKDVYWYEKEKRIELKDKEVKAPTVTDADIIVTDDKNKKQEQKPVIDESGFIGKEKAKEIALNKAKLKAADVKFLRVELDKENGVYIYEVEFQNGLTEYSADIKAIDGTIVDWDVDIDD
ncbi:MAG: PepSY domain-containing protein [Clostridia bacterium]|nr:PepSY domain-containing protein [Clostridia bacterium]